MQHSKILTLATLAVVSALVLVQASQYGNNHARPHGSQYGAALNHYPGAGRQASRGPYGPYHSYAVRPVVYGGHGLYHYKGYARHPPAPRQHKQRYPRSYGVAPSHRRPAASHGCQGRYCGAPQRHYAAQAPRQYNHQAYNLRPVKAVALVPVNRYRSAPAHPQHYQQNNSGYRPAATYGSGRASSHGASHYGAANSNAHQQRYHHGGHRANYNNGY